MIGKGREVGFTIGKIIRDFLPDLPEDIDRERVNTFKNMVEDVAPHWLEEIDGFSEATGIKEESILNFNCEKRKPPENISKECTSFLIMPDRSKENTPLLLKIRDERPLHQIAGIKKIEGTYKYIFGTNAGNIGIAHFLNEYGLAGANNTGSPVISGIKDIGFNDCHIMRIVAEKARDCREALDIIKSLINKGYVSNAGYKRGMIFLFVDNNEGLRVELTSEKLSYEFVNKGIFLYTNHFLLDEMQDIIDKEMAQKVGKSSRIRFSRGKQLIENAGEKIGIEDLMRFSKDTENLPYSLCNPSDKFPWRTLSAFIHKICGEESCSFISNGAPVYTDYFKLNIKEEETPLFLLTDYKLFT